MNQQESSKEKMFTRENDAMMMLKPLQLKGASLDKNHAAKTPRLNSEMINLF